MSDNKNEPEVIEVSTSAEAELEERVNKAREIFYTRMKDKLDELGYGVAFFPNSPDHCVLCMYQPRWDETLCYECASDLEVPDDQ
jgi:hypothetical protein